MENIVETIENQQLPEDLEGYILSSDGNMVTLPKSDLIKLIKLVLPDITFMGFDSNECIKYNKMLEELED